MIRFACPKCRANLKAENDKIGSSVRCPKCSTTFEVPRSIGELVPVSGPYEADEAPVVPKLDRSVERPPRLRPGKARYERRSLVPVLFSIAFVAALCALGGFFFVFTRVNSQGGRREVDEQAKASGQPAKTENARFTVPQPFAQSFGPTTQDPLKRFGISTSPPSPPVTGPKYLSDMQEFGVNVAEKRFAKKGHLGYRAGNPPSDKIRVNGNDSPNGISMCPMSNGYAVAKYRLGRTSGTFIASASLNDSAGAPGEQPGAGKIPTPVTFQVLGDGKLLWCSEPVDVAQVVQECRVNVNGVDVLELRVDCPGSQINAQAVWLEPHVLAASPVPPSPGFTPLGQPSPVGPQRFGMVLDGPRLDIYGGQTRSEWEKLWPQERRAFLLEWIDKKEAAEQLQFEAITRSIKDRLDRMQLPSQSAALAAQVRSLLMPPVDTVSETARVYASHGRIDYLKYHFYVSGPDPNSINAAIDAIGATVRTQEEFARTQREAAGLAEEAQVASLKYAKAMAKWEQKKRETFQKYPQPNDPKFVSYKGLLLKESEMAAVHDFEKEHSTPSAAADSYVFSLPGKSPVYFATYAHATRSDLAAVCYSSVTPGKSQPKFVSLCKTEEGYWFVTPRSNRPDNLWQGNPPKIYKRIEERRNANAKSAASR